MRLLNATTLVLESFDDDSEKPPYAVFSHRWGREEVSYPEWSSPTNDTESKLGYRKIRQLCEKALKEQIFYVWADTCCIDKTSSAELSEAINSMFRWYREAVLCLVYLGDVSACEIYAISSSVWFTRGWTLQELIAPKNLYFYNQSWDFIGSKLACQTMLTEATGIDQAILNGEKDVASASVARRMSWASKRRTTRREDIAYCLLGIFDVNMPMLYGEGQKAFVRLQEEILKSSDDHSIFAWKSSSEVVSPFGGLLASHPKHFEDSASFVPFQGMKRDSLLVTSTNMGLSFEVMITENGGHTLATLNCHEESDPSRFASIYLYQMDGERSQFRRIKLKLLGRGPLRGEPRRIYARPISSTVLAPTRMPPRFSLRNASYSSTSVISAAWINSLTHVYCLDSANNLLEVPRMTWTNPFSLGLFHYLKDHNLKLTLPTVPCTLAVAMRLTYSPPQAANATRIVIMVGSDKHGGFGYRMIEDDTPFHMGPANITSFTEAVIHSSPYNCEFGGNLHLGVDANALGSPELSEEYEVCLRRLSI